MGSLAAREHGHPEVPAMAIVNSSGHDMIVLVLSLAASYLFALPLGWERKAQSEPHIGAAGVAVRYGDDGRRRGNA
jgi:hypothetical protein